MKLMMSQGRKSRVEVRPGGRAGKTSVTTKNIFKRHKEQLKLREARFGHHVVEELRVA